PPHVVDEHIGHMIGRPPLGKGQDHREPALAIDQGDHRALTLLAHHESGSGNALLRPRPLRTVQAAIYRTRLKQVPKAHWQTEVLNSSLWRLHPAVDSRCGGG